MTRPIRTDPPERRDAYPPVCTVPPSLPLLEGALMLDATLWQIDLGDGTHAVVCMACRLPLYRGAKPTADQVFDTHVGEPVVPLTTIPPRPPRGRS
jgi:hypothetical protein